MGGYYIWLPKVVMFKSAKWCLFRKSVGQSSILTLLVANLIYPCWLNGLSLLGGFLGVPPMIAAAKQISDQEFCPFLVWIFPISSHFKPFQDEVAPQKPKTKKKMGGPDGRSLLHFSSALWRGRLVPVSIIFLAGHQRCPSHSAPSPGQAQLGSCLWRLSFGVHVLRHGLELGAVLQGIQKSWRPGDRLKAMTWPSTDGKSFPQILDLLEEPRKKVI